MAINFEPFLFPSMKESDFIGIIIKMTLEHNNKLSNSTKEIFFDDLKHFVAFHICYWLMMMEEANYTIKLRHSDELIRENSIHKCF